MLALIPIHCNTAVSPTAGFTPVLLSVLAGRSSVDNRVTLAVDTRHRLAEPGETETLEASLTRWKEDLS
jgi:hypothetical protein